MNLITIFYMGIDTTHFIPNYFLIVIGVIYIYIYVKRWTVIFNKTNHLVVTVVLRWPGTILQGGYKGS